MVRDGALGAALGTARGQQNGHLEKRHAGSLPPVGPACILDEAAGATWAKGLLASSTRATHELPIAAWAAFVAAVGVMEAALGSAAVAAEVGAFEPHALDALGTLRVGLRTADAVGLGSLAVGAPASRRRLAWHHILNGGNDPS